MLYINCLLLLLGSIELYSVSAALTDLEVRYGTISYTPAGFNSSVQITNTGASSIDTADPLSIYVCLIRLVIGSNEESGAVVHTSPQITAYHLDGCAHKLVVSPFKLAAGSTLNFTLSQEFWSIAYSDVMPNWYMQLGDGEHQLISNTNQDSTGFVDPYDTKEKYLRKSWDGVKPLSLEERYEQQMKLHTATDEEVKARLVPDVLQPFTIDSDTVFVIVTSAEPNGLPAVTYATDATLEEGQFQLKVEDDSGIAKITILTQTDSIADRNAAMSTLVQFAQRYFDTLPVGSFTSKPPRFGYRGLMLDFARQFHGKDAIKRQLDLMWRYKLNVLHLHLADDEAWALEIEDIPELTTIGSKQCFDLDVCATYPQLGRLITPDNGQYLSKADYVEIVTYAQSLGITVLPEIELPGHSTAAINAMRVRYEQSPNAVDYRLHDPEDTSDYQSVQYFTQGAMNPCVDSMFVFVEKVMSTIQGYHNEAGQPLQLIHVAGDEVANGAWTASPACDTLTADLGNVTEGEKDNAIKIHMLKKLGEIAQGLNVSLAFWEDGLNNKSSTEPYVKDEIFPASVDVYGFAWQTVWEWGGGKRAFNMANRGYKVVLTPATRFYLDHAQEPHPNEVGYYWATRYSHLHKVFSFRPINFYANIDGVQGFGAPIAQATFCTSDTCPPLLQPQNIVGVEAPLFAETILSQERMDNNIWPRLLAVAERAWVEGDWEELDGFNPEGLQADFDEFRQTLEQYEIPSIESSHSVGYHLSPPGAIVEKEDATSGTLKLSVEFQKQRVWWRDEDSTDFTESKDFKIEYQKNGKLLYLRTSDAAGKRFSYEVTYDTTPSMTGTTTSHSSVISVSTGVLCAIMCINHI